MDGNNWWRSTEEVSSCIDNDWRNQLNELTRKEMVDKLTEAMKKLYLENTHKDVEKYAIEFEGKMYTFAKSESDYLERLSMKVLQVETEPSPTDKLPTTLYPNPSIQGDNLQASMDCAAQADHTSIKSMMELHPKELCVEASKISQIAQFPIDGNNWLRAKKEESSGNGNDWRNQLNVLTRKEMVDKVMKAFEKRYPEDTARYFESFAIRIEEKVYAVAQSESDYLQRISMKVLRVETEPTQTNILPTPLYPDPSIRGCNSLASMDCAAQADHTSIKSMMELHPKELCVEASKISQIARFPIDGNNWLRAKKEELSGNGNDWRNLLNVLTRKEMVDKVMKAFEKRYPEDMARYLESFAFRIEEKEYAVAQSESDYLQRISMMVLRVETEPTQTNILPTPLYPDPSIRGCNSLASMDSEAQANHTSAGDLEIGCRKN